MNELSYVCPHCGQLIISTTQHILKVLDPIRCVKCNYWGMIEEITYRLNVSKAKENLL